MSPLERLIAMLRPAGGGVHVVTTGLEEQRALQRVIYSAHCDAAIEPAWRDALAGLAGAKVALLGVPCDTGAGFARGSNMAPAALRSHALASGIPLPGPDGIDLGDTRVVPHFLSDSMLSDTQVAATRQVFYGKPDTDLPVSPLDMCRAVLDLARQLSPRLVPIVLGGDHSVGWPAFASAHAAWTAQGGTLGLLHFDAHTDLLSSRLGVDICFATWAWHANQLLNRDGRLAQIGIRISGKTQAHWESTEGVRQVWAEDAMARGAADVGAELIARFEALGVDGLYVSNDIDGTDPTFAAATGTPEPGGLSADFVVELTELMGQRFPLVGADLVEVAPTLAGHIPGEPERTLATSLRYLEQFCRLAIR